jgi:hypothetical protein
MSAIAIPKTAPFLDEEISLLNRVGRPREPDAARVACRFSGRRRGLVGGATARAAASVSAEPLTIVFASESGNSDGSPAISPRLLGRAG